MSSKKFYSVVVKYKDGNQDFFMIETKSKADAEMIFDNYFSSSLGDVVSREVKETFKREGVILVGGTDERV